MDQAGLLGTLEARVGEELHVSPWMDVDQARINAFAEATGDFQWIHVDAERAARESPWGAPIAHGFLLLSLYPFLRDLLNPAAPAYPGVRSVINYGLNRVRFPSAVPVGSRVRARFSLVGVAAVAGGLQVTEGYTVEVDGADKPACVAEAILRLYL